MGFLNFGMVSLSQVSWFCILMQSACIAFGLQLTSGGGLVSNSSAAMASGIQTGALVLNQYRLKSLLATSAWPKSNFQDYNKMSYLLKDTIFDGVATLKSP